MKKAKKTPMRMCVACQEMKPKTDLMRVVSEENGGMQVDPTGRMAGRGAYICKELVCIEKALKEKRFERALKRALPEGFADAIRQVGRQ